jgi:NAD(P)H-hydrate epimerase
LLQFNNDPPGAALDALLGTGFSGTVKEPFLSLIETINALKCPVISVDLPSGLDADRGTVSGAGVKADVTVSFGLPKTGTLRASAQKYVGKLRIADIGFPKPLIEKFIR